MSTDIIARTAPRFQENSPRALRTQESSTDPISYQNLNIVRKLGKGKFPVYLVNSNINNQNYVMKIFSDFVRDSQDYYKNELRFTSLSHPNVINMVSTDKDKTIVQKGLILRVTYILSEYAPHGDLFDFILQHKDEIDEKLARTYFRQLIDGLEYLHSLGISHLDIKPENLLIGADFNLKIADFDLSHIAGDSKVMSRGTRMYRAPEFYNYDNSEIKMESPAAADIYSAAIILFLLKCGGVYPQPEHCVIDGLDFTELMEKESSKFWSMHTELQRKPKDFFDSKFKKLFRKMTKTNPKQRLSIKKIKKSKWYNGPVYTPQELQIKMKSILNC